MLDRLGIFDLFSYTVPGAIYLAELITALYLWPIAPPLPLLDLNASILLLLGTIAYLIGLLVSPVKWTPWDRVFPYRQAASILEKLQQTYPEVTLKMHPDQWPVLQANTGLADREFSLSVDKLRATHIMLRSVSLALCVAVLLAWVHAIGHPDSLLSWLGGFSFLGGSALAAKGSRIFKSWTYHYTFELMIARVVTPEDFVDRKPCSPDQS